MSLATRCTACGTVFRVVQDQLKVSEGWVRCGRCNEVFNALQGLFDLERDTPPEWSPEPPRPIPAASAGDATEPFQIETPASTSDPSLTDRIDAQLLGSHFNEDGSTPATRVNQRDRLEFPDARFDPELLVDDPTPSDPGAASVLPEQIPPEASEAVAAPEFVQRAQRQARWKSLKVRSALVAASLVLAVTLALQVGHHFRDLMATRWPATKPALADWCGWWSCTIEAARRIDDVFVESSALTRAAAPDDFRLSVALRNRGTIALALPAVDLSLTDPTGRLLARRVLMPREFGLTTGVLQSGAEANLQLVLTAGNARVTGYTVEIFYP